MVRHSRQRRTAHTISDSGLRRLGMSGVVVSRRENPHTSRTAWTHSRTRCRTQRTDFSYFPYMRARERVIPRSASVVSLRPCVGRMADTPRRQGRMHHAVRDARTARCSASLHALNLTSWTPASTWTPRIVNPAAFGFALSRAAFRECVRDLCGFFFRGECGRAPRTPLSALASAAGGGQGGELHCTGRAAIRPIRHARKLAIAPGSGRAD